MATQVNDRFHLYKNLTEYTIDYLKKKLKLVVEIIGIDTIENTTGSSQEIPLSNGNRNRNYIAEWKKKSKMSDNLYRVATSTVAYYFMIKQVNKNTNRVPA